MKKTSLLPLILTLFMSCGGGTQENNNTASDSTQNQENTQTSEENRDAGEKLCFASEGPTTFGYSFLIIQGNQVKGRMRTETPKAGMTLYEECSVSGTKEGETLKLTLTTVDTDEGQGIGDTRQENWILKGDELTLPDDNLIGLQKKISCEGAYFEAKAMEAAEPQSYELDGLMDTKLKIKMFLNVKPSEEDKKMLDCEGYYYYISQGKDKKIDLKGSYLFGPFTPLELFEKQGDKSFGKFMIDASTNFGSEFECVWISADGKKELKTTFKPAK